MQVNSILRDVVGPVESSFSTLDITAIQNEGTLILVLIICNRTCSTTIFATLQHLALFHVLKFCTCQFANLCKLNKNFVIFYYHFIPRHCNSKENIETCSFCQICRYPVQIPKTYMKL